MVPSARVQVTTMLLIAPVSISVMRQCNQDPVPLLIAMVGALQGRARLRQPRSWRALAPVLFLGSLHPASAGNGTGGELGRSQSQVPAACSCASTGAHEQRWGRCHHGGRPACPHHR